MRGGQGRNGFAVLHFVAVLRMRPGPAAPLQGRDRGEAREPVGLIRPGALETIVRTTAQFTIGGAGI